MSDREPGLALGSRGYTARRGTAGARRPAPLIGRGPARGAPVGAAGRGAPALFAPRRVQDTNILFIVVFTTPARGTRGPTPRRASGRAHPAGGARRSAPRPGLSGPGPPPGAGRSCRPRAAAVTPARQAVVPRPGHDGRRAGARNGRHLGFETSVWHASCSIRGAWANQAEGPPGRWP